MSCSANQYTELSQIRGQQQDNSTRQIYQSSNSQQVTHPIDLLSQTDRRNELFLSQASMIDATTTDASTFKSKLNQVQTTNSQAETQLNIVIRDPVKQSANDKKNKKFKSTNSLNNISKRKSNKQNEGILSVRYFALGHFKILTHQTYKLTKIVSIHVCKTTKFQWKQIQLEEYCEIQTLKLSFSYVQSQILIKVIHSLRFLEQLQIQQGCEIIAAGKMKQYLKIQDNPHLVMQQTGLMLQNIKKIKILIIKSCRSLNKISLIEFQNLEQLRLQNLDIEELELKNILNLKRFEIKNCPKLKTQNVKITNCNDDILKNILIEKCPQLKGQNIQVTKQSDDCKIQNFLYLTHSK